MSKLDAAIKPQVDPGKLDIGTSTDGSSASKEGHNAEKEKGSAESKANHAEKANMSAGKNEGPGKGLTEEVKQVQREAMDVSKETSARGGTSSMGSVNSSLGETRQMASKADMQHRKGIQKDLMSQMKDIAGNGMKMAGGALNKAGTAMNTAGEAMSNTGRGLLSNPFTAAAGAAMIAAGTALQVAGKALKAAGAALEKAGDGMKRISTVMKRQGSKFSKVATQQAQKGKKKIAQARNSLQKMREANQKKALGGMGKGPPGHGLASGPGSEVGSQGVKPLDAGVANKVEAASQKFKANPAEYDRKLLEKAGESGANKRVGASKTLEDMNPAGKKVDELGAGSKKLTKEDLVLDPKTSAKLDKLDPKKMEADDALLKKAGQESPKDTLGRLNKGSKTAEFPNPAKAPADVAEEAAKKGGSKWKKYALWGGGGAFALYEGNKMLGGGSADTGAPEGTQRKERFATWEEFNQHYGFDKPQPPPNYQSGYTSYYNSQKSTGYGNSMLDNNNPLFGYGSGYSYGYA